MSLHLLASSKTIVLIIIVCSILTIIYIFLVRRPFGVEDEYFVQLFVEHDESLKLPTIGELLKRMFKDQNILFTKVYLANIIMASFNLMLLLI